jgi:ABC-type uncharacterized transport system involved in gliding motility auxiliary subunit
MVSIFVGITLLVNAISIGNYHRFDLTGVSQFTLTSQTIEVLKNMEIPVKALCFFIPDDNYGIGNYATSLLEEYQNHTDKLSIERIDPDEHPDIARQYGVTSYQTVIFESELGNRMVYPDELLITSGDQITGIEAENPFTSAILEVTGVAQKKVYFLTGHGESDIMGEYNGARQGLLDNLYKVDELDLMRTMVMPNDCSALIIAAPQKELNDTEIEIIEEYLDNNGWLMVLLNPGCPESFKELLSKWYVTIEDGTVIDESSYVTPNMDNPLIPRTRNQFGLAETYFPGAVAIIPEENCPEDIMLMPLFYTSGASWIEKNLTTNEDPEYNEGTDIYGSQAIGVLVAVVPPEEDESADAMKLTRLIVIGDSDFASDQHFYNGDNGALFLNCVEILTTGTEIIKIERKVLPFRRMLIEAEDQTFIQISSIGLLPLLVLIGGGIIWWRRK